jgi:hypothetical protein
MAEQKNVNYTDEQTSELVAAYEAAETPEARDAVVEEFAETFGKTVRSIRAKLVREGVYVKKAYKTKTGGKPETKEGVVCDIAAILGVDADAKLGGLEKANKGALQLIRATLLVASERLMNQEEETH